MDIQAMVDSLGIAMRDTRVNYHLTLGKLIDGLREAPSDMSVRFDFPDTAPGLADSYRGYYEDLAFEPVTEPRTVEQVLSQAMLAVGNTFTGYKGGDFLMKEDTPLWVSSYGASSGCAIIGLKIDEGGVVLTTKDTHNE